MRRLRHFLIFLLGLSIPFNNYAISFAGTTWSLGLISSALYFISMLSDFHKIPVIVKIYGRFILNIFYFAIMLTFANVINANIYGTPVFPTTLFLCCVLFYVLLLHDKLDNGVILRCVYGIAFGCILMSILFLLGIGVTIGDDARIVMFGENANLLGVYMCLGAVIIFNRFILNEKPNRRLFKCIWYIILVPIILLLVSTSSRVAFISLILSFFLSVFLYRTRRRLRKYLLLFILVIVGFILYRYLLDSDFIILQRLQMVTQEGGLSGRDEIWSKLWPDVINHLFYGVGVTGYVDISMESLGMLFVSGGNTYGYSPHNVLIELILYTGIWGFLLFVGFWWKTCHSALVAIKTSSDALPFILFVSIIGCILSGQILNDKWV